MEIRKIWTSADINDYVLFPYCGQVAFIHRHREILKSKESKPETVFCITSLSKEKASPARLLDLARGHWGIENKSHYVRDVTFDEDRSQVRIRSGPRVMATLRNFAISALRFSGYANIAKGLRTMASKPHLVIRMFAV